MLCIHPFLILTFLTDCSVAEVSLVRRLCYLHHEVKKIVGKVGEQRSHLAVFICIQSEGVTERRKVNQVQELFFICLHVALEQHAWGVTMRSIKKRYNMIDSYELLVPFSGYLNLHSDHCCCWRIWTPAATSALVFPRQTKLGSIPVVELLACTSTKKMSLQGRCTASYDMTCVSMFLYLFF